jgi:hypothetical protein
MMPIGTTVSPFLGCRSIFRGDCCPDLLREPFTGLGRLPPMPSTPTDTRPDLRATLGNLIATLHRAATIADRLPAVPGACKPIDWHDDLISLAAHVRLFSDQVDQMPPADRPRVLMTSR